MILQALIRTARTWFGVASRRGDPQRKIFPTEIELPPKPVYEAVTRAYNFLGALAGLLLLSPLLLLIALAVKLTSRGPALYRGARVGRGEAPFDIFKFRTMKTGSEARIGARLVRQDEDHYTSIGKFLRRYRLDELAQLLNVLRGDMNLVGPRPLRPIFLEEFKADIAGYARRFTVRPGITGQAQVRGGYYTRPRHKLFYDLLYIAHRSVWVDLGLIILTFVRVMTRIFTTGVLFAWLLAMAIVLPNWVHAMFTLRWGSTGVNALYLVPTLIAVSHAVRREVTTGRIYALKTPVDLPLFGFLAVSGLLVVLSRFPYESMRGLLWYICNGAIVFHLVLNSRVATERRTLLVGSLVGATATLGALAIGQMLHGAWLTGEFSRLAGSDGNPLTLAAITVLTLPLALSRYQRTRQHSRKLVYLCALSLLAATTLLTLSRSGFLAVGVALAVYFFPTRRKVVLAVAAVILATAALLGSLGDERFRPSDVLSDLSAVSARQADAISHLSPARLAVGVGARTLPEHMRQARLRRQGRHAKVLKVRGVENTYLTLLLDHGPLGFAFFLAFFVGSIRFMLRSAPRIQDTSARADLWATVSGLMGCAVLMFFSDALYQFPMMIVFFSAMGLGMGVALNYRDGPRAVYRIVHYRHQL